MTLQAQIINAIHAQGKRHFLNDIIDDDAVRNRLVEQYLEDEDVSALLTSVHAYVNGQLEQKLENAMFPGERVDLDLFNGAYKRVKIIYALVSAGHSTYIQPVTEKNTQPCPGFAGGDVQQFQAGETESGGCF